MRMLVLILFFYAINDVANSQTNSVSDYPVDLWGDHLGCYDVKLTNGDKLFTSSSMTYNTCWKYCQKKYSNFAGLTNGNSCFCTNNNSNAVLVDDATNCNQNCAGNSYQKCGSQSGIILFKLNLYTNRLREVIKNMEVKNIYVHRKNDVEWIRYNQDAIDLRLTELTRDQNSVFEYLAPQAYVELTGSVDVIYSMTPGSPSLTLINAIWDIVFAINKREVAGNTEVIYHRKTQCVWVEKVNGEITDEFNFVRFKVQNAKANDFTLVLSNVKSPAQTVTITFNNLIKDNDNYIGKWFNVNNYKNIADYFIPDLFACK